MPGWQRGGLLEGFSPQGGGCWAWTPQRGPGNSLLVLVVVLVVVLLLLMLVLMLVLALVVLVLHPQ